LQIVDNYTHSKALKIKAFFDIIIKQTDKKWQSSEAMISFCMRVTHTGIIQTYRFSSEI